MQTAKPLFSYTKYWAECFGTAPFLPTTREEMDQLGWDSCDVIIITGDAYVDHPSFGMAVIGRLLEAQGFRVGIIDQPDWRNKNDFMSLGKPNLFFGVAAGNMDSMINRYTADKRERSDDAYSPDDAGGKRPDRAVIVYSQRCREAWKDVPIVLGSIEASLRRIAHYDYWSDEVRRSILVDSQADILLYGNAERAVAEVAQRLSRGQDISQVSDIRGTAVLREDLPEGWTIIDSTRVDTPGKVDAILNPYETVEEQAAATGGKCSVGRDEDSGEQVLHFVPHREKVDRAKTAIRLPPYHKVKTDPVLYAHASRVLHLETNPGNARALVQRHGNVEVWLNPPPIPLTTDEMDDVFGLPFARVPHPKYEGRRIPAYEMIRFSVNIMRGCFGGCTFCSITEHEGRIIQSRSEDSIINEIEKIRDMTPGFTGVISDLGGPTANMYRLACKTTEIESACRRLSCVYPGICSNLNTDHNPLISLYRRARDLPGVKKVLIASGLRYDLAVESPEYVEELVTHHVGGYLKIAPEHTEDGPLSKMMKPGIGTYERFSAMFEKFTKKAGKKQYLIPYFIAAHPGTSENDMVELALWLKSHNFRADQVQTYYPSPMATATAMYHSGRNPLKRISYKRGEKISPVRDLDKRRLHKALLRYHDPANWPAIRDYLKSAGRAELIGDGEGCLIPEAEQNSGRRGAKNVRHFSTQHLRSKSRLGDGRAPKSPRPRKA
ncbi:MAG: YgiQ family radical SAM protein [Gammaproteobacteria bacterium]|nr:YgiQ family radical SAM protein [Gammaproteobacteria bacterium]MBQ0839624.1 YgiQ family radical SAM protein [Gammaproteobacteria bacterium]